MNHESVKVEKPYFIDAIWKFFFRLQTMCFFVAVVACFFIAGLYHRYIYIDDAWFGEQSYWFAKYGYARAISIKDFFGWEDRLFVYHKLNIIIGAAIIKVFGWSVYYFKTFTLLVYILFFFVYYKFFAYFNTKFSCWHFAIASFYIFIIPLMISLGFTFRPEFLIMLFGFLSYTFLEKFLATNQNAFIILAAVFAGLAFLTHLNGMIFCFAGFVALVVKRNWKALFIFSIVCGFVSAFYFYDLWQPGHLEQFLFQIRSWPDDISTNYNSKGFFGLLFKTVSKLISEQKRYFWSERVQVTTLIFLLSLIYNFKELLRDHKILLVYLLVLAVTLNLFGSQIAERYLIYLFPYFGIVVSIAVVKLSNERNFVLKGLFLSMFILQFFFVGRINAEIFKKNFNGVAASHEMLEKITEKDALVLVPYEYVFNEIESRNLASYKGFEYYQVMNGAFTQQTFFARAKKLGIKYIVINKELITQEDSSFPFFANGQIDSNSFYTTYYRQNDALILIAK